MSVKINDVWYKIEPTSCACGGSWAWLKERPSRAWEMVGCVCHHLPTGERVPAEWETLLLLETATTESLIRELSVRRDIDKILVRESRVTHLVEADPHGKDGDILKRMVEEVREVSRWRENNA